MVCYAAFLHPFKRRFDSTYTDTSALEPSTTSDNSNKQAKYGNINGIPVNNPNETSHLEGNSSCEELEVGSEKQMPKVDENNSKGGSDSEDGRGLMKSDIDSDTDTIATTCWKRTKRNIMPEVEAPNKDYAVDPPTRGECSPSDILKTANQVAETIATGIKDLLSQILSIKQTANDLLEGVIPILQQLRESVPQMVEELKGIQWLPQQQVQLLCHNNQLLEVQRECSLVKLQMKQGALKSSSRVFQATTQRQKTATVTVSQSIEGP